jgi:2-oxo-4-hydroxy-4-carboxy-5-ureidoimidazoline decarboxylase
MNLDSLNALDREGFAAALEPVFENAPWVAQETWASRPFATVADLHAALFAVVQARPDAKKIGFLQGHPDLGGAAARARAMTASSIHEQGGLGLAALDDAGFARFETLNAAYRDRFGFPFITCVARHTRGSILAEFVRRSAQDRAAELEAALHEVFLITRLRLVALVDGPGAPHTTGKLSTHVLDTSIGRPAAGVAVTLFEMDGAEGRALVATVTDGDGRTTEPLLTGVPLRIGTYELHFAVAPYFAGRAVADPAFLDVVKLRFSIAEPEGDYHVPLLVAPWGYTTYRGS